jgi:hypothetical protein
MSLRHPPIPQNGLNASLKNQSLSRRSEKTTLLLPAASLACSIRDGNRSPARSGEARTMCRTLPIVALRSGGATCVNPASASRHFTTGLAAEVRIAKPGDIIRLAFRRYPVLAGNGRRFTE